MTVDWYKYLPSPCEALGYNWLSLGGKGLEGRENSEVTLLGRGIEASPFHHLIPTKIHRHTSSHLLISSWG